MIDQRKINDDTEPTIKLIDFGFAEYYKNQKFPNGVMNEILGTPFYVAPEVLSKSYTLACDYWSIGVIAYILLAGYPPFSGNTENEIFAKIQTCNYQFNDQDWIGITKHA